jgi:integrase
MSSKRTIRLLRARYQWTRSPEGFGAWFAAAAEALPPNTLRSYAFAVDLFVGYSRKAGIAPVDATAAEVSLFVRRLQDGEITGPVKEVTVRARVAALRSCFRYLVLTGRIERNPVVTATTKPPVWSYRRDEEAEGVTGWGRLPRIPSFLEWRRLLASAGEDTPRNRLLFLLTYFGALRRSEVVALRIEHIDFRRSTILVPEAATKSRRERLMLYPDELSSCLGEHLRVRARERAGSGALFLSESRRNRTQQLGPKGWYCAAKRLAERAGVPSFAPHHLRHLRLTHLAEAGWSAAQIAAFADHSSPRTTHQYIHLSGRKMRERLESAVRAVDLDVLSRTGALK